MASRRMISPELFIKQDKEQQLREGPQEFVEFAPVRSSEETLEERVRRVYFSLCAARSGDDSFGSRPVIAYDGGYDPKTRTNKKPVWPKIAACIESLNADVTEYLQCQFLAQPMGKIPYPNTLYGYKAISIWQSYLSALAIDAEDRLRREIEIVNSRSLPLIRNLGWSVAAATQYVLLDNSLLLLPIVRYVLAVNAGLESLAAASYHKAVRQYVLHRETCDRVFGEQIPAALKSVCV